MEKTKAKRGNVTEISMTQMKRIGAIKGCVYLGSADIGYAEGIGYITWGRNLDADGAEHWLNKGCDLVRQIEGGWHEFVLPEDLANTLLSITIKCS